MKNLVKFVCNELNITQKELSLKIGVSEGSVNRWSSSPDNMSLQTQKTLCLLLETQNLKKELEMYQSFFSTLTKIQKERHVRSIK